MKLTLSKLFDTDSIVKRFNDAKIAGMEDFVSSVSDLSDRLIQILRNNVSLADNIDCAIKEIPLSHDQVLTIENPDRLKQVAHILVTRTDSFLTPVTSFSWQFDAKGQIQLKAQFLTAPTTPVKVTLVMYF